MRLAFVDDPARLAELQPGDVLVATDPDVEIAAAQHGCDAVRFWGSVDPLLLEEDAESGYADVVEACDTLDALLAPGASAHWHLREIKLVVESVRSRWLAAEALVAALGPTSATLLLRAGTPTYEVLASGLPALGLDVSASPGQATPPAPADASRPNRLRGLFAWHLRRSPRSGSPLVLCSDALYGVEPIAAELRRRGADVRLLIPAPVRPRALQVPQPGLDAFAELFSVGRAELAPVGLPRIALLLERGLPESRAAYEGARRTLRRSRPDAVLGSAYEAPRLKAIAAAAHDEGVPVLVSRHGEMGARHDPSGAFQDLDAIDVALSWGEWEARQIADYTRGHVRSVVVGAPSIEAEAAPDRAAVRAELGFGDAELLVLYLPVAFDMGAWLANRAAPNDSDHLLHQRSVLAALGSVPGTTTVLKAAPTSPGALAEASLLAAAPTARIVTGRPYSELVHLADVVVVDFPSTTLVQALRGSARIVLVDHPALVWTPGAREHLSSYGVLFAEPDRLAELLVAERAAGRLAGPHAYPWEALEPLVASGPGTAAERAAEAILHIVSEQPVTTIGSR
jgi:hypothetical protein